MIRHARIRSLPRPDQAEYAWDPEAVCVILSDDVPLAAALEKRLTLRGWRVLRRPASARLNPTAGADTLAPLTTGRIGALISVAPRSAPRPKGRSTGEDLLGGPHEESWLFEQFRLARQLSPALNTPGAPRTWWVAVTRLDGNLGLAATSLDSGVVTAGVYGLVKTLGLEWPSVFCRSIDLHPALDAAFVAERIVEELHDPDPTLAEVGHTLDGRVTVGLSEPGLSEPGLSEPGLSERGGQSEAHHV